MVKKLITHLDDCDIIREIVIEYLSSKYEVFSLNPKSSNYYTPEDLLNSLPKIFDSKLIITDYQMGVFTGFDIVKYLRKNNYVAPIYCLTTDCMNENILKTFSDYDVILYCKEDLSLLEKKIIEVLDK